MMPAKIPPRRGRARRGNAIIEFSFLAPLLVALFLGAWSFGYSYFLYGELLAAVRAGARYASIRNYDAADTANFRSAVRNVVVYGNPNGGANALVPDLTTGHVTVSVTPAMGAPTSVTVAINGYQVYGMYNRITLVGKPALEAPFLGRYVP